MTQAQEALILSMQRLVGAVAVKIMRQYSIPERFRSDLFEEAQLELVRSAIIYDSSKSNLPFNRFASFRMACSCINFLRKEKAFNKTDHSRTMLRFPKFARRGTEYGEWQRLQPILRRQRLRRKLSLGYNLDVAALRRSILAHSGIAF